MTVIVVMHRFHILNICRVCALYGVYFLLILKVKPEDLKRSPDRLNNVKIAQGQLRLVIENTFCFTIYEGGGHFGQVT